MKLKHGTRWALAVAVAAVGISALLLVRAHRTLFHTRQALDEKTAAAEQLTRREEQYRQELKTLQSQMEQQTDAAYASRTEAALDAFLPGIVCWGDSLTAGAGGDGTTYPLVLEQRIAREVLVPGLSVPVVNMGVGGETSWTILGRNGAVPFILSQDVLIPAGTDPIQVEICSKSGHSVAPAIQGMAGLEYVKLGGVTGTLQCRVPTGPEELPVYYFRRQEAGEAVSVPAGSEFTTAGSQDFRNLIPIIFIGANGQYDDPASLIRQQQALLRHQQGNPFRNGEPRYLVVGLPIGSAQSQRELEQAMEEAFGRHFVNLRQYLAESAMEDAGLSPTSADLERMDAGQVPASLLSDHIHFTAVGYELIGNLLFDRMEALGYFDEVREAIRQDSLS